MSSRHYQERPAPRTVAELQPGDRVWLTPRTLGASSVCWGEPKAVVVRVEPGVPGDVVVRVKGKEHRVSRGNVRLSDPSRRYLADPTPRTRTRPELPEGCTEVPLW